MWAFSRIWGYIPIGTIISWSTQTLAALSWTGTQSPGSINWFSDFLLLKFLSHILLTMHSGKRDLPYTNSHFPAKPSASFSLLRRSKLRRKTQPQEAKRKPLPPSPEEGWASRHPEHPAQTNTLSSESSFWCDAPLQLCCNDESEPNTPSWMLQAVAQREHFLLPQPDAPSGAPSWDRLESLGWILPQQPQHGSFSFCHLEFFSPVGEWSWLFCYNKLPNFTP